MKTALVLGVANNRSIGWACVKELLRRQYQVIFTYQNDRFERTANQLIQQEHAMGGNGDPIHSHSQGHGNDIRDASFSLRATVCDVSRDIPSFFEQKLPEMLGGTNDKLDVIVHSIAYAPPDAMKEGALLTTSREAFLEAHAISSYSFLETARCSLPLLDPDASMTTLSFLGAVRAVPHYNVMGPAKASLEATMRGLAIEMPHRIRVNCVSPGPLSTMAARGIRDFGRMKDDYIERAPLGRNATVDEVASTIGYVACDATGMTGQTLYVDCGYNTVAGPPYKEGEP